MPDKHALITWGGWDGHTPKQSAELFKAVLEQASYTVTLREGTDAYADAELMGTVDLINQNISAGELTDDQWQGLDAAVKAGAGFAGFHGGSIDSFRTHTKYQFMTGGQWVAHPGNSEAQYTVRTVDPDHEIVKGIESFELAGTEQYYMHVDPAVHVLMTTRFEQGLGDTREYPLGVEMPYVWTRQWGQGKVFIAAWGHTYEDFDVPETKEIVKRGMLWATR